MFFDEFKNDLRLGTVNGTGGWTNNDAVGGYGGTRSGADDPLAGIQPDWTQARYSELLGEEVVEVPFEGIIQSMVFPKDSAEMEMISPPNTTIKLIAGLGSYGQIYYNVVYVSCTWTYLETHDIFTLTINDLDSDFSGIIRRHEISGGFIDGKVILNGEVVGTLNMQSNQQIPSSGIMQTLGGCRLISAWVWIAQTPNDLDDPHVHDEWMENGNYGMWIEYWKQIWVCDNGQGGNNGNSSSGTDNGNPNTHTGENPGGNLPNNNNNNNDNGKPPVITVTNDMNNPNNPNEPKKPDDDSEEPEIIIPELEIKVSSSTVTLGQGFTVTLTVKPNTVKLESEVFLEATGGDVPDIRPITKGVNSFIARAPATHMLTAMTTVKVGESKIIITSSPVKITVNCPYAATVEADGNVQSAMNIAWASTCSNATTTSIREYGFPVYVNSTGIGLSYEVGTIEAGPPSGYEKGTAPHISIDYQDILGGLFTGGKWCVLMVHTHPPLNNAPDGTWRPVGPSQEDYTEARNKKMPSYVLDVNGFQDETGTYITNNMEVFSSYHIYRIPPSVRGVLF